MLIELGVNKSPYNKINKDFTITETLSDATKDPFSERNPVVEIAGTVMGVNYARIDGLYYFITDVIHLNNGLSQVHFSLDLLMSYKDYINSLDTYIQNDSIGNPDIIDNRIQLSGRKVTRSTFIDTMDMTESGGSYVVVTSQDGINRT